MKNAHERAKSKERPVKKKHQHQFEIKHFMTVSCLETRFYTHKKKTKINKAAKNCNNNNNNTNTYCKMQM